MVKTISATTDVSQERYGRYEVKKAFHRNFVHGMIISIAIHAAIIGSYYISQVIGEDDENIPMVKVRIMRYSDLGPPPSISQAPAPPSVAVQAMAKPTVGVPVPVPDADVSAEQTIATQQELSSAPSPALEDLGGGGDVQITQDIKIDDGDPAMDEFIPYEKGPEIVKKVTPKYPEMALRAGLEGTVWVKILVDKDGKPKKAVVIKSTVEIFNDAAVEAAMQFVFTPAVMNNGAVRVWVALPFKFQLRDTQPS
jgi:periplasmic protein TonB